MRNLIVMMVFTVLNLNFVQATGMKIETNCTPVLQEDGQVDLKFMVVSMSAPGGPASSSGTVTIAGKDYQRVKSGVYEQGLKIKNVPLRYPSGSVSSSLVFITVTPGKTGVKPVNEVLYNCVAQ